MQYKISFAKVFKIFNMYTNTIYSFLNDGWFCASDAFSILLYSGVVVWSVVCCVRSATRRYVASYHNKIRPHDSRETM
jgi:hypothetical protein